MDTPDHTTSKRCTKCGKEYPATTDNFYRSAGGKYGLKSACIPCSSAKSNEWRAANKDKTSAARKSWYASNRERRSEYNRAYREAHREYFASYMKVWGEENKEHKATTYKAWCQANPDKSRARGHRYRTSKLGLPSSLSASDWQFALSYFEGCCAACGRPPGLWHTLVADHWIPLSSSDCPGTVAWNIVPLCHDKKDGVGGCNNSKYNTRPAEWLVKKYGKRKGWSILLRIEEYLKSRNPNRNET